MGRRCKKCEKPLLDKKKNLCAVCEIECTQPTTETDLEFAKIYDEYHKDNNGPFPNDLLRHNARLQILEKTSTEKDELANLKDVQVYLEGKQKELKNKLLMLALSAKKTEKRSAPLSESVTVSPNKSQEKSAHLVDYNSNSISKVNSDKVYKKESTGVQTDFALEARSNDEIDGKALSRVNQDEDNNFKKPGVVRRKSSVKDHIKTFENLYRRYSEGGKSGKC